ncbi:MAG: hypothetical protein A3G25_09410 [Betaproteobacteria bacterium RIFCSPLOWO2_12_FULL_63_13]|nr:MAG: hypothetical protein A3H32_01710 [Betaproteobacteria bacterium RIFCSPLOWO2_02_FULL_63_19]OGA44679.1 MAG: hypothetical protein A3G25_09410 [Betaproteobacteria bacterium RIFCSPLOWO2_12_FULL_63_13]
MAKPVVNIADIELQPRAAAPTGPAADRYDAKIGRIGAGIGAKQLGYNVAAVAPGEEKPKMFRYLGRESQSVDYWEGE